MLFSCDNFGSYMFALNDCGFFLEPSNDSQLVANSLHLFFACLFQACSLITGTQKTVKRGISQPQVFVAQHYHSKTK